MRDSMGGVIVLAIIIFFVVIVSGYMAFNVNYMKAFRVKNKIIAVYDDYNGKCDIGSECQAEINSYIASVGYHPHLDSCPSLGKKSGTLVNDSYCVYELYTDISDDSLSKGIESGRYFRIYTVIDINIPVVRNVFGTNYRFLSITGDTKVYR